MARRRRVVASTSISDNKGLMELNTQVVIRDRRVRQALQAVRAAQRGDLLEVIRRLRFFSTAAHARRGGIKLKTEELSEESNRH